MMSNLTYTQENATDLADAQRHAYNAAFYELGLRWHWDSASYDCALCADGQRAHLRHYLQTEQAHLLKAYEAEFLIDAIQTAAARCLNSSGAHTATGGNLVNWAAFQLGDIGF